jgi:cell division protein FtsB
MLTKIKIDQYLKKLNILINKFSDIRFTGQVIFGIIVILVFWSGASAIEANYNLQQQITQLKEQNLIMKLQNNNIILQNKYYKTNQYQELSARANLGLAYPGETELIVPSSVALKYTVNLNPNLNSSHNTVSNIGYLKNLNDWLNFFFDRN